MRCSPDRQAGFTLIEVMAAGVILSVLVMGLTQLWAVAGERSLDSLLRQKAVFVLGGEMERLAALYNMTGFGATVANDTSGYGDPAAFPDSRAVFRTGVNAFMATAGDAFVTDSVATFEAGADALVLLDDDADDTADRNYVWVDRSRGVLGRLSWAQAEVTVTNTGAGPNGVTPDASLTGLCFDFGGGAGGANCREISLYLEYPFRLKSGVPTADPFTETLPLKTIVGRWR